jgi:ATP-dependent Clp protease protease subunit
MSFMKRTPMTGRKALKKNTATADEAAALQSLIGGADGTTNSLGLSAIDMFSLESIGSYMYFDDVSQESSKQLIEFILKANFVFTKDTTLTVLINSYGGDVYAGFSAIDVMEVSRLPIQTVGIGAICSMASLIFTAGTPGKRMMSRNSYIMTHQYQEEFGGGYHDFVAMRKTQDDMHRRFVDHFVKRTHMSEKQVKATLLGSTDKWINAKDALKLGLCDVIRDPWQDDEAA